MPCKLPLPIVYPITSGTTTRQTIPDDPHLSNILRLAQAAVDAEVPLFQIREKSLSSRVLYELVTSARAIMRGSQTRLLVNDNVEIAQAAGADGVQLTSRSLPTPVVRRLCGSDFLIGVSTHTVEEAIRAQKGGADFILFGPIFETESKRVFGAPQGLDKLEEVTAAVVKIPVVAIGGITLDTVGPCFESGALGVAAIRLLNDVETLSQTVEEIRRRFAE